jgi:hypothetical protein
LAASDARVTLSVGDEHIGFEVIESLASDCGEIGWRLIAARSSLSRGFLRAGPAGREDRGVKNRPNRRGVTDGWRLSLRRPVLEGDINGPAGDEDMAAAVEAGGLEGTESVYGP